MDEQKLKEQLKDGSLAGAYLFYGEENYLKQFYVSRVVKKCVPEGFEGFNLHKYDGESADLQDIMDASQMLPMMSERVVVLVRDFNLSALDSDNLKRFEEYLSDLPETTVAVFWMDAISFNAKKEAKWRKIVELFNKHGNALDIEKKDKAYLVKTVVSGAQKRQKNISSADAAYLVDTVGDDLNILQNELDKLCAYCENEIDRKAIDTLATRSMTVKAFELTKAISQKNIERAFEILNVFFAQKAEPPVILGEVTGAYVDMYRAKVSLAAGEKADALASDFGYKNTAFRLTNGARDASKMTVEQLRDCLNVLDEADASIKSGASDNRLALEELLIKLTLISNK